VPASATAVDLVVALVEPGRIAGFPVQALEYSTLHGGSPAFEHHPRFDTWLAEPVLALAPDLVVVDAWNAPDTNARLAEAGVRVHRLREVRGFEDACAALRELAAAVGAEERAEALVAELEARKARLVARAEARGPRPRALCYSNFGASGWSAGSETTIHEVMQLAGCVNLLAEAGERGHVELDFERLLVLDPDLILVSQPLAMGEGPAGDRGGASEAVLLSEPALASLRAVRERRIARLPAWLYATGSHEIVTAAEYLADELDRLPGER
jgi:iron complex transport system substrate-binding protein